MALKRITSAMLLLTHSCNLKCRYCFVNQSSQHMSYDTALSAARFLIRNANDQGDVPSINFFGGEPLLRWEEVIVPLTNWLRRSYGGAFSLSMTTNGVLLDREKLDFMRKNNIGILLSLDGDRETQDFNRPMHDGTGSFDQVIKYLDDILCMHPGITLRMTAIPETCGNLFKNILFGVSRGYTNFFVTPNVFEPWDGESRAVMETELRKYSDYYINSFLEGKRPIVFSSFENALRDILQINDALVRGKRRSHQSARAENKCGLGASRFASIHPDGSMYSCQEMTSNVGRDSIFFIGDIFHGEDDARREFLMNEFRSQEVVGSNCKTCQYDAICNGGCVANNYMATGSMTTVPDVYCWWSQTLLSNAIYVMQTLGDAQNELFIRHWREMNGGTNSHS